MSDLCATIQARAQELTLYPVSVTPVTSGGVMITCTRSCDLVALLAILGERWRWSSTLLHEARDTDDVLRITVVPNSYTQDPAPKKSVAAVPVWAEQLTPSARMALVSFMSMADACDLTHHRTGVVCVQPPAGKSFVVTSEMVDTVAAVAAAVQLSPWCITIDFSMRRMRPADDSDSDEPSAKRARTTKF